MKKILIRATVNALGLVRGDEVWVDNDYTAQVMIRSGYWQWQNAPAPTYAQYAMTEAVKERVKRAREVGLTEEAFVSIWDAQESPGEALDEEESD